MLHLCPGGYKSCRGRQSFPGEDKSFPGGDKKSPGVRGVQGTYKTSARERELYLGCTPSSRYAECTFPKKARCNFYAFLNPLKWLLNLCNPFQKRTKTHLGSTSSVLFKNILKLQFFKIFYLIFFSIWLPPRGRWRRWCRLPVSGLGGR